MSITSMPMVPARVPMAMAMPMPMSPMSPMNMAGMASVACMARMARVPELCMHMSMAVFCLSAVGSQPVAMLMRPEDPGNVEAPH